MLWMDEIWMENHVVINNNCNIEIYNAQIYLQKMTNNGLHLVSVTTIVRFTNSIEQDK